MTLNGYSVESDEIGGKMSLEPSCGEDGRICISVILLEGTDICGLGARILYDDTLEFISAKVADKGLAGAAEISSRASDGVISFILDGDNNALSGKVAEFVFRVGRDLSKELFEFEILSEEAYCWEDDRLVEVRLGGAGASVLNPFCSRGGILTKATVNTELGETFLLLEGMDEDGCLAGGFDIALLETESGIGEHYRSVCAMPKSGEGPSVFLQKLQIPKNGIVCVAVYPITYNGCRVTRGRCEIFVFSGGELSDRFSVVQ